jgi:hypothetical protein
MEFLPKVERTSNTAGRHRVASGFGDLRAVYGIVNARGNEFADNLAPPVATVHHATQQGIG